MKRLYTLLQANRVLTLVRAIANELVERRAPLRLQERRRQQFESCRTPEGMTSTLADLDLRIQEEEEAIAQCRLELEDLGMTVLRCNPLTVHIPGQSRSGPVVFCWEEGEQSVCFGHPPGEEEEPRRPLRLKAI